MFLDKNWDYPSMGLTELTTCLFNRWQDYETTVGAFVLLLNVPRFKLIYWLALYDMCISLLT